MRNLRILIGAFALGISGILTNVYPVKFLPRLSKMPPRGAQLNPILLLFNRG
jgi:hypothetical protein